MLLPEARAPPFYFSFSSSYPGAISSEITAVGPVTVAIEVQIAITMAVAALAEAVVKEYSY